MPKKPARASRLVSNRSFLDYFSDKAPALRVRFRYKSDEAMETVKVEHWLGAAPDANGAAFLKGLARFPAMAQFCAFYQQHDGLKLCKCFHPRHRKAIELIEFLPAAQIEPYTKRFLPGGQSATVIDWNKSKKIYRGKDQWMVFARGESLLTIFLDGPSAGKIFVLTLEPEFNILRPIAHDFSGLLERIAKDMAAFLRLLRLTVTLRATDGDLYGFAPVEYLPDAKPTRKPGERVPTPD